MRTNYTLSNRRRIKQENYEKTVDLFQSSKGNLTCKELGQQLGIGEHTVQAYLSEYFKQKKIFQ